jgi:hypothetical protein
MADNARVTATHAAAEADGRKRDERWKAIPGSFGPPLAGHTVAFYRDDLGLVRRSHAAYGPVFRLRIFGQPQVVLVGAAIQAPLDRLPLRLRPA